MMRWLLSIFAFLLIIGCSDEHPHANIPSGDTKVIVSVDGRSLTKGVLSARVEMMLKLRQLQRKDMRVAEVEKIRKDLTKTYPAFFIEHAIWANYADAEKIGIDEKLLERVRMRAVRSIGRGKGQKYAAFRSKFGKLAPVLDEHVRMMALSASAKRHVCDLNPTNIPPDYASNIVQQVKAYNSSIVLTNAMIYARATNCWQKLTAGADFVDMVLEYSELEQERKDKGEWGTLDLQQLEPDEALHSFVKTHAPGDISPPLEGDNGLMILRIDGRKEAECKLSRIYFQLPMFAQERTVEQILKHEHDMHDNRIIAAKYRKLKKAAKIVRGEAKSGVKAKGGKKKKVPAAKRPAKLSPEEEKRLEEQKKAEDKLREEVKKELFSGSKPKSESKDSPTKK